MHLRRIFLFSLALLVSVYLPANGAEQTVPAAGAAAQTETTDAGTANNTGTAGAGTAEQQPAEIQPNESNGEAVPANKDVVLVLDNSGSMKKNDPDFLTKTAVTDFINHLDTNTRVAVEIFDQTVRIAVPFTFVTDANRAQILESLKQLNYRGKLTDTPSAIERAIYELKNDGRADARKMIVLMTDGIVDTGNPTTSAEKSRWLQNELAPAAADAGIKIFGIAFTEEADFQLIQTLAQKTHGDYFRALAPGDLKDVFEHINTEINRRPKPKPKPQPAPKAAPAPPPAPIIVHVPVQRAQGIEQEERLHSIIIIVAAIVMMVTLIAIIYLLVRRGRQLAGPDDQYVAEAFLNDLSGNTSQSTYKLGRKPTMLGRVEGQDHEHLNYVVIPQSTVGRRHALIEYKDFGYWIADQGSINGTFVNDKAISTEVRLKHGDRVRLHKFEFEFVMPEMSDAGMTVVSNTVYAAGEGASAEATVMKGDAGAAAPVPEPDFDIGIGDSQEGSEHDEEDTVMRGGGESTSREEYSSEDETLLPGSQAPASSRPAATQAADDETLMPGHAPGRESEPEFSTDDETLMPSGPEPGKVSRSPKSGGDKGDFFDITGAETDDDQHR